MARNFRVKNQNKKTRSLRLQLYGDFDGASADQLLQFLRGKIRKADTVTIDTNGLRHVNTFGVDILMPHIAQMGTAQANILFSGKFKSTFSSD